MFFPIRYGKLGPIIWLDQACLRPGILKGGRVKLASEGIFYGNLVDQRLPFIWRSR
jgi:hypothetical protein